MHIRARIENRPGEHRVELATDDRTHALAVPPKPEGAGSAANGGELLFLALATCYCNDLYREAAREGIRVRRVEVEVTGAFGGPGEPAREVTYRARVEADADAGAIEALMRRTDALTEIQNTLRQGVAVTLTDAEAIPTGA